MVFNVEQTVLDMLGAVEEVTKNEDSQIKETLGQILKVHKSTLRLIAEARINGDINDHDLNEHVVKEKESFESGLSMIKVKDKAVIQRTIRAALDVFLQAIEKSF